MNPQPPLFKALRDEIGRARFFVAQFGEGMDASSQGLDFVSRGQDFRYEFHDAFDYEMTFEKMALLSLLSNEPFYAEVL
ncbi:hypothetical protein [Trinickia sp. Y13]|uniref:hypothetical protein n=1 Tax=Trinickia sp. Y13 TaxID=2917807 RepID=UPI002405BB35|nr:hypothetical protein [Trinickia sp. Y13]MDG0025355.1 hypothetical protein [Trinickia sp. Y13]